MSVIKQIEASLSPYMCEQGFSRHGTFFDRIQHNMAFCIEIEATPSAIHMNYYVMPLYLPCENRYVTYGNRTDCLKSNPAHKPLSRDANTDEIARWCAEGVFLLREVILPFFNSIDTPRKLREFVKSKKASSCFFCPKVYIHRLMSFTDLFLQDSSAGAQSLRAYRHAIRKNDFLTEDVRDRLWQEAETLERLFSAPPKKTAIYFETVVAHSLQLL